MCLELCLRYLPDNIKFMVYSTTAAVVNLRLSFIFWASEKDLSSDFKCSLRLAFRFRAKLTTLTVYWASTRRGKLCCGHKATNYKYSDSSHFITPFITILIRGTVYRFFFLTASVLGWTCEATLWWTRSLVGPLDHWYLLWQEETGQRWELFRTNE